MNEGGQSGLARRRVPVAVVVASVALLGASAIPAFDSGNAAYMVLWVVAVGMWVTAVSDLRLRGIPGAAEETRHGPWWDVAVTGAVGALSGMAAAQTWAWVSSRVDDCPPSAPFGGCGGERVIVGLASPLALGIIALVLVLLKVSRGGLIGVAAAPVTAAIVALYNARLPGTPVPSSGLMVVLTSAGFLLAWASSARVVPAPLRFGLLAVLLSSPLLTAYLDQ